MGDVQRELLGGDDNSDRPSAGEALAEVQEEIAKIEAGDLSGVAPWSTAEVALADLRRQERGEELPL